MDDTATVAGAEDAEDAFLDTLSEDDQKSAVLYDYTDLDTKRCSWSNFPNLFDGRLGVALAGL